METAPQPLRWRRSPRWSRTRYQALYLQLPFELAPALLSYPRVVVPPRRGSRDEGRPPVHIRFHLAPEATRVLDQRAVTIAVTRSPSPTRAENAVSPWLGRLQARIDSPERPRVSVAEVETTTLAGPFNAAASQELTTYSLQALNRFLDVYQVLTEQWDVHHLNPENLGPEVVVELRRRSDAPTGRLAMPHHRAIFPHERGEPEEHLLPMLTDALRREPYNHPLDLVRRLHRRATRLAESGEYEAAIDTLQSSAERLVFAIHQLVLAEQGLSFVAIQSIMPSTFAKALKTLSHELGGDWSITGGGPVARYWNGLYLVRNQVAHLGISPERDAVPEAFDSYGALWSFILERTLEMRSRLPRTALAVHGGVGLKKAGGLDRRMREFIEALNASGDQDTFWLPADERPI